MQADTVEIKTEARSERYFAGDKNNHVTDSSTRHFASTIDGDDIVIFSVGGTRIDGSKISATQSLRLTGGNVLSTDDKTFGESVSSHRTFRSNSIASELNGATVVLVTEHGDIEITGSQINARAGLVMSSSDDIRIEAGHDDSMRAGSAADRFIPKPRISRAKSGSPRLAAVSMPRAWCWMHPVISN
jgi:ribosomal protein S6E (S10)